MDLLERLQHDLSRTRLIPRHSRLVVAVSGGVDSMVLLHALKTLAPDFGWKLSVVHFNHRLRGRSSDADERFVRRVARQLGLSCDVGAGDVRRTAVRRGISIEMAAREMRHAFLARCARKRGTTMVALAHHADDQAELFLLRLLRGAGGDGLGGMEPCGVSAADRRVRLVRPLLALSKDEIKSFARASRVKFREDASNASPDFDRNWIRLELLPLLRRRQPAIVQTTLRAMEIIRAESDFVRTVANSLPLRRGRRGLAALAAKAVAVQRRLLRQQIRELGVEPEFHLVEALRTQPGRSVSVGPALALVRDDAGCVRRAQPSDAGFSSGELHLSLPAATSISRPALEVEVVKFGGLQLSWQIMGRPAVKSLQRRAGRELFDADKVGHRLRLRHWQAGDRFQPIGMAQPTKLQDWFTNRKVPAARRRQLVLAESERGQIFWVQGERIGEVAKITPDTRRVLELRWKQL